MKKAFVFDFDGTIVDSNLLERETMLKTLKLFKDENFSLNDLLPFFGPTEDGIITRLVDKEKLPQALDFFFSYYKKKQEELLSFDEEMRSLFAFLKENGKRIFILTGRSPKTLDMSLSFLHLEDMFEKCYTGHMDGSFKDLRMNELLEENNLSKDEVIYLGDTTTDVRLMRKIDVDIISCGYYADKEYFKKVISLNDNYVLTLSELKEKIGGYL